MAQGSNSITNSASSVLILLHTTQFDDMMKILAAAALMLTPALATDASCAANPGCAHLSGDCCPNGDGTTLGCCADAPAVAPADAPTDAPADAPTDAPAGSPVTPPDSTVVKAIIWSENIVLSVVGIAMATAPLYRLSGMLSRKVRVGDELLCFAGIISLTVVLLNFFGGTLFAAGLAGEPPHFISQVLFAIVVGGALKLHANESDAIKMGVDIICVVLAVLASAPTVGYVTAAIGVVVGLGIGFLLGTLTMGSFAREIQPENDYYIRA